MARIEISSVSNPYGTGELQLQGKVAMSGTLTSVTDNLNTASPLKLSTGVVQVVSTLRVTTNDNPYFDAEDGAGNNRFTIGRDSSSQQVNVDFASNPTGSTTIVGAIRTYVDGTNLSEIMTFREDGNVGVGTTTPTGKLHVAGVIGVGVTGIQGSISFKRPSDGSEQGQIIAPNNGINFYGGASCITMSNGSGNAIGSAPIYTIPAMWGIKGSGSTSATTSLLAQNSAGITTLQVLDDGKSYLYGQQVWTGKSDIGEIAFSNEATYGDKRFSIGFTNNIGWFQSTFGGNKNNIILARDSSQVGFATSTLPVASAQVQIDSTTRGFLPPRMTNAQRLAITTPAVGLMVYCTDAVEGLYVFKSTGWTFVI